MNKKIFVLGLSKVIIGLLMIFCFYFFGIFDFVGEKIMATVCVFFGCIFLAIYEGLGKGVRKELLKNEPS